MKVNIGNIPYVYPIPAALIGSMIDGKINYTLIGDVGVLGINPALIYVSLNESHLITKGVEQSHKFSINFPNSKLLSEADYCGVRSGYDYDKSKLFTNSFVDNIPMIDECPVTLICSVLHKVQIKQRVIYMCEVNYTYVDEKLFNKEGNKIIFNDLSDFDPIIYALDNNYYKIGQKIGKGYKEFKNIDND